MKVRIALLLAAAVAAGILYPQFASAPNLDRAALALALAGPAAAAALAAATGRPVLVMTALAGLGAYVSGVLSLHGVIVPVAVLAGIAAGGGAGACVAVLGAKLSGPALLVATLLLTLAGGAAVQALPGLTGADAGLGPLSPPSIPLSGGRNAVLTPTGDFHLLLGVAVFSVIVALLLIERGPGAAWRAIGSDRARAAASGLRPLAGEVAVLAVGGVLAALSGALAAHVSRVATPAGFAPDVAALPLLAALAAGRQPLGAALVAVATGLVGQVVLPAVGWQGPPDAMSLALGILAVATVFTLVPSAGGKRKEAEPPPVDPDAPWPLAGLDLRGGRLESEPIVVRSPNGEVLVDAPAMRVEMGAVHAVVGPNGAGKSTLLRALAQRSMRRGGGVEVTVGDGHAAAVLLPQEGGGFAACTVRETLRLAARADHPRATADELARAWLVRLGMEGAGATLCAELSGGQRRLLDLARVLLGSPSVVLCDEPLAGLDESQRAAAISCLRAAAAAGLTIVLAEHDRAAVASLASSVVELQRADWVQQPRPRSLPVVP